ncbi:hypothetical protein DNTS_009899, partial [Danionella cerebrum]
DSECSEKFLTLTRTALISAACELPICDKRVFAEKLHRLKDLTRISSQMTFHTTKQVVQHALDISSALAASKGGAEDVLDSGTLNALLSLLSGVLEGPVLSYKPGHWLSNKVMHASTQLILDFMLSNNISQYSVNTSVMQISAWKGDRSHSVTKTFDLTTFQLSDLQFHHWRSNRQQKPCVITWVAAYSQNLYGSSRNMEFCTEVADIRLFNCTTRREIKVRHLSTPVTIGFWRKEITEQSRQMLLLRSQVNIHQFNITALRLHRAVQITLEFSRPLEKPFPILLLFSVCVATGPVYLMLLNADYNKSTSNQYISRAVNYTLGVESVDCLSRDDRNQWKPREDCFPHAGISPRQIYCSCSHLASFAVSHETINSSFRSVDVSQFIHSETNCIPIVCSLVILALHLVLLGFCWKTDASLLKATGSFLLPENKVSEPFLYAITIDTGFRSRSRMTAKVPVVKTLL